MDIATMKPHNDLCILILASVVVRIFLFGASSFFKENMTDFRFKDGTDQLMPVP